MKRYVVTNTILSRAEGATPADVTYFRGGDEAQALAALLTAATLRGAGDKSVLPVEMQFDVTSVRLDIFEVEAEPEPGERVDFDENNREMPEPVQHVAPEPQTYSLAEIRNGTGFERGVRFMRVP